MRQDYPRFAARIRQRRIRATVIFLVVMAGTIAYVALTWLNNESRIADCVAQGQTRQQCSRGLGTEWVQVSNIAAVVGGGALVSFYWYWRGLDKQKTQHPGYEPYWLEHTTIDQINRRDRWLLIAYLGGCIALGLFLLIFVPNNTQPFGERLARTALVIGFFLLLFGPFYAYGRRHFHRQREKLVAYHASRAETGDDQAAPSTD